MRVALCVAYESCEIEISIIIKSAKAMERICKIKTFDWSENMKEFDSEI